MATKILIIDDEIERESALAQNIEEIFNNFFGKYYNIECEFIYTKTWDDDFQIIIDENANKKMKHFSEEEKAKTYLQKDKEAITAILLDYFFKGQSQQGPSILKDIRNTGYSGPVIILTVGTGDEREAIDLIQTKGATAYILKDDLYNQEKINEILERVFILPDKLKVRIIRENQQTFVLDLLMNDFSILKRAVHLTEAKMPALLYLYMSALLNQQEISFQDIINNLDKFVEIFDIENFIKKFIDYSILEANRIIHEEDFNNIENIIIKLKENLSQISREGNWPDIIYDINNNIKNSLKPEYKGKIIGLFGTKRGRRGEGEVHLLYKILANVEIIDNNFDYAIEKKLLELAHQIKDPGRKKSILIKLSKILDSSQSPAKKIKMKIRKPLTDT